MEKVVQNYTLAATSLIENLKDSPVAGGFKKVCLASMDYLARVKMGAPLDDDKKVVLGNILTIGTTINDYYDLGLLKPEKYKELRRRFQKLAPEREADFLVYRRTLSDLEKTRPEPSVLDDETRRTRIVEYREKVNRLSLAFTFSVAYKKPLGDFYEIDGTLSEKDRAVFEGYLNAVMALQVVDDIVGRGGDLRGNRPSFYTAFCEQQEIIDGIPNKGNQKIFKNMDYLFTYYCRKAEENSPAELKPILSATRAIKAIYPVFTDIARKNAKLSTIAGVNLLTWRDNRNL